MGIFLRQSHNVKPRIWGSPAEVQYSIWRNLEDIYGCDHESEVLIMPMFWGFPLLDYSKYGNHGTNHGATYKDGSLDFDGSDDYVNCGDDASIALTGDTTVSVWVKFDIINYGRIYQQVTDVNDGIAFSTNSETNKFQCNIDRNGPIVFSAEGGSIATGNWYYAVVTWDGSTGKIYQNGVSQTLSSKSFGYPAGAKNATIGMGYNDDRFIDGTIPEVRISNVARSADQTALFYGRPWDLYRRIAKPVWSIPAEPSIYIPRIIMF